MSATSSVSPRQALRGKAALGRRPSRGVHRKDWVWGYLLILPTLFGLGLFSIWPAIQTLYFSFTEWGAFGGNTWTGLDNYLEVLTDPSVGRAFLNTFVYSAVVMLSIPLSIFFAALLNRKGIKGVSVYRTIYFLPVVTLPAAIALVWRLLYNGDFGPVNRALAAIGVEGRYWLADSQTALLAVSLVAVWSSIGYNLVLFLAGLQGIPAELYEAAELDGAGAIRQFLSVTLPMLTPTIFFVTVITVINALQAFDLIYLMIGPNNPALDSAKTVVYLFYEKGIIQNNGGYAAALGFVLLAVVLVATLVQFRVQKKWVHYE